VQTTLKFKRLSAKEIESYANSKEGIGKAGGYSIRGYAESFIELISGSYSNVVGLPLTETLKVLEPFRR
jgi:septum formation protein